MIPLTYTDCLKFASLCICTIMNSLKLSMFSASKMLELLHDPFEHIEISVITMIRLMQLCSIAQVCFVYRTCSPYTVPR